MVTKLDLKEGQEVTICMGALGVKSHLAKEQLVQVLWWEGMWCIKGPQKAKEQLVLECEGECYPLCWGGKGVVFLLGARGSQGYFQQQQGPMVRALFQ